MQAIKSQSRHQSAAASYMVLFLIMAARDSVAGDKPAGAPGPQDTLGSQPCRKIVVSIRDRKLALLENGELLKVYSAAVGASVSPTPAGVYKIATRVPNPTYYKPGKVVPPGGANPLGTRWLGLSLKGYGIHGTNSPRSIGKAASHGCIRLRNKDVEELFELVRPGDVVELHDDSNPELAQIFAASPSSAAQAAPTPASASAAAAGNGRNQR